MSETSGSRRPIKTRNASFAKMIAHWLSERSVTPNQISMASVGFAILAACSLLMIAYSSPFFIRTFAILAALFIQGRLLCNLFDGMVAVEGGKGTKSGELFNDIPDRIADPIILIAAGYAIWSIGWGGVLGWAAGLLAVITAYVRTLAASLGAPVNFQGPMAKQHRMAVITVSCVAMAVWPTDAILLVALPVIICGCVLTIYRRIKSAHNYLESRP